MNESPHHIALIEDAESDVLLIREALEQAGLKFDLRVMGDGEEALEFIAKIDNDETMPLPRLIILDLNLPKVSGGQVLERVRQSSRCGSVPVLVLTSSDSPKDKAEIAQFTATSTFENLENLSDLVSS
jgi:two-component system, chemotaxis family, response regulator Rcp1